MLMLFLKGNVVGTVDLAEDSHAVCSARQKGLGVARH